MGEAKAAVHSSRLKNHPRFDGLKIYVIGSWKRRRGQIRDIAIKLGSLPFSDFANLQNRLSEWNKWSHAAEVDVGRSGSRVGFVRIYEFA